MHAGIRLAIVHRRRLLREGLALALSQQPGMVVVASVAKASEVMDTMEQLCPHVIVIDFAMPGREGLGEACQLHRTFPEVKILMIGMTELESDVLACIEAGAAGYLSQEASLEDLREHVRAVAAGEALCSPKVVGFLFSWVAERARQQERLRALEFPHLTRREKEILALIEARLSNKEIAVRLKIELQTVKNHVHNILDKLHLNSRREVAQYVRAQGLLDTVS